MAPATDPLGHQGMLQDSHLNALTKDYLETVAARVGVRAPCSLSKPEQIRRLRNRVSANDLREHDMLDKLFRRAWKACYSYSDRQENIEVLRRNCVDKRWDPDPPPVRRTPSQWSSYDTDDYDLGPRYDLSPPGTPRAYEAPSSSASSASRRWSSSPPGTPRAYEARSSVTASPSDWQSRHLSRRNSGASASVLAEARASASSATKKQDEHSLGVKIVGVGVIVFVLSLCTPSVWKFLLLCAMLKKCATG